MGKQQREDAKEAAINCGSFTGKIPAHSDTLPTLGYFFCLLKHQNQTMHVKWIKLTPCFSWWKKSFLGPAAGKECRTGNHWRQSKWTGVVWRRKERLHPAAIPKCHHASPARNGNLSFRRSQVTERGGKSFCSCAVYNPRPASYPGASHVWGIGVEEGEKGSGILLGPCLRCILSFPWIQGASQVIYASFP